jgi:GNAT superfamily N-acetyltransferase
MTEIARFGQSAGPASAAEFRPIGLDDLASVRYIHASSFRMLAAQHYSPEDVDAFTEYVYGVDYTDALAAALHREQLYGAWLEDELVGTAGWASADDGRPVARLRFIFVRPLFTGMGLGRHLVLAAEDRARQARFHAFTVYATVNAVGFFTRLGYELASYGVRPLSTACALRLAIMQKMDPDTSVCAVEARPAASDTAEP